MADNNLPPQSQQDPTRETPVSRDSTRPNTPLLDDDTEQNIRHKTEILRPASLPRQRPSQTGTHVQAVTGQTPRTPPPAGYQPRPRRQRNNPKDSALYLPWWSIILMLIGVMVVSFGLVAGVMILRGSGNFLSEPEPIILIVTAQPQNVQGSTLPTNSAPSTQIISGQNAPSSLQLAGPTLPPVQISATPAPIRLGSTVMVEGVDVNTLNVRNLPSLTQSSVIFRAEEGRLFTIVEGPETSDGFTWWRIQDPNDPNIVGWAVSNFLSVQP